MQSVADNCELYNWPDNELEYITSDSVVIGLSKFRTVENEAGIREHTNSFIATYFSDVNGERQIHVGRILLILHLCHGEQTIPFIVAYWFRNSADHVPFGLKYTADRDFSPYRDLFSVCHAEDLTHTVSAYPISAEIVPHGLVVIKHTNAHYRDRKHRLACFFRSRSLLKA